MLSKFYCVLCLLVIVLCGVRARSIDDFTPGEPLTSEEFMQASNIQVDDESRDDEILEPDFLEDDIISTPVIKLSQPMEQSLWPDGVVPYLLDKKYDKKGRLLIARAFQELHNKTCVRFVPRSNEEDHIVLKKGPGCASYVGRIGEAQTVILGSGCYSLGIFLHELMHSLGFIHEQSRLDRDKYVIVKWENIKQGTEDNFRIWNWYSDEILREKYDYYSLLHYSRFAFSKDPQKKPTLIPKKNVVIGQRKGLSEEDIRKIKIVYKCR